MYKKIMILMLIGIFAIGSVSAQSNWSDFWLKFKTAVAKGDKQTIYKLTDIPNIREQYAELFGTPAKRKCFAKAKPISDTIGGYNVYCGEQGYIFRKINGTYMFAETFAND